MDTVEAHDEPPSRGPQRLDGGTRLARHRHSRGYVAIVVDGSFRETGDLGCIAASAGYVIVHGRWEAHRDEVAASGAWVVNLPLDLRLPPGAYSGGDIDESVRAAREGAIAEAAARLEAGLRPVPRRLDGPADLLLEDISRDPGLGIAAWAIGRRVRLAGVSRAFRTRFGVSPKRFRVEAKTRAALAAIRRNEEPLARIACSAGFSDQPHMNRAVLEMTGRPPGYWLRV